METFYVAYYLHYFIRMMIFCSPVAFNLGTGVVPSSDSGYACVLNCTFQYAPLWSNLLSFKTPSENLLNAVKPSGHQFSLLSQTESETVRRTCYVLDGFQDCIHLCPQNSMSYPIMASISGLTTFCSNDQRLVNGEPFQEAANCLHQFADDLRTQCRIQNEALFASALNVQKISTLMPIASLSESIQDICQRALDHINCIFPKVLNKCNASGANLFDMILQSSIGSLRELLGSGVTKHNMIPNCRRLLDSRIMFDQGRAKVVTPQAGKTFPPYSFLLWPSPTPSTNGLNGSSTLNDSSLFNTSIPASFLNYSDVAISTATGTSVTTTNDATKFKNNVITSSLFSCLAAMSIAFFYS